MPSNAYARTGALWAIDLIGVCTMNGTPLKLPIGIRNFEKLRTGGYLYVDKTKVYRPTRIPALSS